MCVTAPLAAGMEYATMAHHAPKSRLLWSVQSVTGVPAIEAASFAEQLTTNSLAAVWVLMMSGEAVAVPTSSSKSSIVIVPPAEAQMMATCVLWIWLPP